MSKIARGPELRNALCSAVRCTLSEVGTLRPIGLLVGISLVLSACSGSEEEDLRKGREAEASVMKSTAQAEALFMTRIREKTRVDNGVFYQDTPFGINA